MVHTRTDNSIRLSSLEVGAGLAKSSTWTTWFMAANILARLSRLDQSVSSLADICPAISTDYSLVFASEISYHGRGIRVGSRRHLESRLNCVSKRTEIKNQIAVSFILESEFLTNL